MFPSHFLGNNTTGFSEHPHTHGSQATMQSIVNPARNRTINGSMMVDQRNNGAAVSLTNVVSFTADQWVVHSQGMTTTVQRKAYLEKPYALTVTMPASTTTGNYIPIIRQTIEGYSIADLMWGTAQAKPVTLNFKFAGPVTGIYYVSFLTGATDVAYVTSIAVLQADTWGEYTVTIPGCTTGTWNIVSGGGLIFRITLAANGSYVNPPPSLNNWVSGNFWAGSDQADASSALGGVCALTDVQLVVGERVEPFEPPLYSDELNRCQRYYQISRAITNVYSAGTVWVPAIGPLRVNMRTTPSIKFSVNNAANIGDITTWSSPILLWAGAPAQATGVAAFDIFLYADASL
jgi:hypothetical protein